MGKTYLFLEKNWPPRVPAALLHHSITDLIFETMMKKAFFWVMSLTAILMTGFFTACDKTDELTTEDAVDQALYAAQERGGLGKYGCYELVFPVTVTMPDGTTTITANSYDELREGFRSFFQANGGNRPRGGRFGGGNRPHPSFQLPITVINEAGETIVVETEAALRQLRADCGAATFSSHGWQGHGQFGLTCFELVFPVTVQYPDGTTKSVADATALRQLALDWRKNNPGSTNRPSLQFPVSVKMKSDGAIVAVSSQAAMIELRKGCR